MNTDSSFGFFWYVTENHNGTFSSGHIRIYLNVQTLTASPLMAQLKPKNMALFYGFEREIAA